MGGMKTSEAYAYVMMRVVSGALFMLHGTSKLFSWPHPGPAELDAQLWLAAGIEAVFGLGVVLGFYTRFCAFWCSGLMAGAYWLKHFPREVWPTDRAGQGGELALLYCFLFFFIFQHGSGKWSVDRQIENQKKG